MKNNVIAVVLCAIVLFVWGFFSWAVLPWHNSVANKFTSESAISQALIDNAPSAGVYYLPFAQEDYHPDAVMAFVNVLPNGTDASMGSMMGISVLSHLVAASLVLWLLSFTAISNYGQRVLFVTGIGLAVGFISHYPYWNWFGFSTSYVLVIILDTTIAWFLAGLVMAKFTSTKV